MADAKKFLLAFSTQRISVLNLEWVPGDWVVAFLKIRK